MAEGLVHDLADFAAETFRDGPPPPIADLVAQRLTDTIAVALAAGDEAPVRIVRSVAAAEGGPGAATVLGSGERLSPSAAALVNGTMAHALDFDDTHLPSILHPSASVVPAALAVAQTTRSSGAEVVAALAAGLEITCRLGMAAYDSGRRNSIFFENGFHATSICGTLGAAAAASLLLGGGPGILAHALGIAASMGAGLLEANRTGGAVKRTHCGWAAHAGVVAARLAAAGLTGPPTVLEGRFGFFRAYTGGFLDHDALVGGLGDRWAAERIFTKPYPTNHFTHAGIDAAIALRSAGLAVSEVVGMELGVAGPTLRTIAEPAEDKARPTTGYHARFSGPFTVATALVGGGGLGVSSEDFDDRSVHDPERLRLAALVRCHEDEEASAGFPDDFPGVLTVRLRDGTVAEHRVVHTRGGPDRPLSRAELAAKFRLCAAPSLGGDAAADELFELAAGIADLDEAGMIVAAATVA